MSANPALERDMGGRLRAAILNFAPTNAASVAALESVRAEHAALAQTDPQSGKRVAQVAGGPERRNGVGDATIRNAVYRPDADGPVGLTRTQMVLPVPFPVPGVPPAAGGADPSRFRNAQPPSLEDLRLRLLQTPVGQAALVARMYRDALTRLYAFTPTAPNAPGTETHTGHPVPPPVGTGPLVNIPPKVDTAIPPFPSDPGIEPTFREEFRAHPRDHRESTTVFPDQSDAWTGPFVNEMAGYKRIDDDPIQLGRPDTILPNPTRREFSGIKEDKIKNILNDQVFNQGEIIGYGDRATVITRPASADQGERDFEAMIKSLGGNPDSADRNQRVDAATGKKYVVRSYKLEDYTILYRTRSGKWEPTLEINGPSIKETKYAFKIRYTR